MLAISPFLRRLLREFLRSPNVLVEYSLKNTALEYQICRFYYLVKIHSNILPTKLTNFIVKTKKKKIRFKTHFFFFLQQYKISEGLYSAFPCSFLRVHYVHMSKFCNNQLPLQMMAPGLVSLDGQWNQRLLPICNLYKTKN